MSYIKYSESINPKNVNNRSPVLLMLSALALLWGAGVYAGGCDPVVEGEYIGRVNYSAVYSSCTATEGAVENTVAIKYNPSGFGVIDKVIATYSAFSPRAPLSTASIGSIMSDNYYAQDMGIRYSGDCTDMTGVLRATPTAVSGHYYCFRFMGSDGTLYIGGAFGALNTFSNGKATILSKSDFVTTWKTDNPGTSPDNSFILPIVGGPYELDLENDGVFDYVLTGPTTPVFLSGAGTYTIRIRGTFDSIRIDSGGDKEKILSVDQWGTNTWTTMYNAFYGAVNLTIPATDTPDFSAVTSMFFMFADATSANPDTSGWNTSEVTDMEFMFLNATSADPDTSGWDTSKVTSMWSMFTRATSANPDTSGWDTSEVEDMRFMFFGATSANPDTSGWDTSKNSGMFRMFGDATSANPDTSNWDTSGVYDMGYVFDGAASANPDTSGWDTSKVWNMDMMFRGATSFNRDIGSWDVTALSSADEMLKGVTLSTQNYDSLLVGWNAQLLQPSVNFDGGNSTYCSAAAIAARANMIASDSWTIVDGGPSCPPQVTCNVNIIASESEDGDATYEACDILSLGPDYIAVSRANITANSGWEIDFQPGFTVEEGATLNANVCGQSLCEASPSPMPAGCHSCVDLICASDTFCCFTAFDTSCVVQVDTVCNLICRE